MKKHETTLLFRLLVSASLISGIQNQPPSTGYSNYNVSTPYGHTPVDPTHTFIAPGTEIELSVSCVNLSDKDILSKSDPMCVTYTRPFNSDRWEEIHRSEVIPNNLSPSFTKKPILPHTFNLQQSVMFKIYDVDSTDSRLNEQDFLGYAECNLEELESRGCLTLPVRRKNLMGVEKASSKTQLTVILEKLLPNNDKVRMRLSGTNIAKKDLFGKSDPYIEIFRRADSGNFQIVHRTEVVDNNQNPVWQVLTLPIKIVCNGNDERLLKFVCYDYDKKGSPDYIGEFQTTFSAIRNQQVKSFELKDIRKTGKLNRVTGTISIGEFHLEQIPMLASSTPPQNVITHQQGYGVAPVHQPPNAYPPSGVPVPAPSHTHYPPSGVPMPAPSHTHYPPSGVPMPAASHTHYPPANAGYAPGPTTQHPPSYAPWAPNYSQPFQQFHYRGPLPPGPQQLSYGGFHMPPYGGYQQPMAQNGSFQYPQHGTPQPPPFYGNSRNQPPPPPHY